jgi:hypothetical protein
MLRLSQCCGFITFVSIVLSCEAQYKGDHIPGFAGLGRDLMTRDEIPNTRFA